MFPNKPGHNLPRNPRHAVPSMQKATVADLEHSQVKARPQEVMPKATQTCVRYTKTQPEPPKHKHKPTDLDSRYGYGRRLSALLQPTPLAKQHRDKVSYLQETPQRMARPHHLPPMPPLSLGKYKMPIDIEASGDRVVYKNSKYGKDSSVEPLLSDSAFQRTKERTSKEHTSPLESARDRVKKTHARINAKYAIKDTPRTDTESNTDCDSKKTTARTAITCKSGDALRSVIQSQIKLQEKMNQSISKMTELTDRLVKSDRTALPSLGLSARSTDGGESATYPYNLGAKDVISCKVMAPIMHRIQRLYLKNMQEEMLILEDLERVPELVDEVYQSFKYKLESKRKI